MTSHKNNWYYIKNIQKETGEKTNMKSHEKYLQDLRQWLHDTSDCPLEEMSDFFTKRLDGYEEHMSIWEKSYLLFA